ncbi:MAG: DHH family phosphoesterase [Pirellulaceae bacterium]
MTIDWDRFATVVEQHQSFLLTSHLRPDCDAIGSERAMAGILKALGKDVTIVNASETPTHIRFTDPDGEVKQLRVDVQAADLVNAFDAIMVLDTSAWIQLGEMGQVIRDSNCAKLILDHHQGDDDLGAEVFKDSNAEATGRLVWEAAQKLEVKLTPEIATLMFTAIATDTGWFRFNSVTGFTYRVIGDLVDHGAVPSEIFAQLFENDRLERVQLRGRILSGTRVIHDGRLAYSIATRQDFEKSGAGAGDTEDVINRTMAIAGVEAAIMFIELPDREEIKVSFRSCSDLDVSALASQFGGGGHKAASGATMNPPLDEVVRQVLDATKLAMG